MKATGYVTVAERPLDRAEYPGADPGALVPDRAGGGPLRALGAKRLLDEPVLSGARASKLDFVAGTSLWRDGDRSRG